MKRGVSVFLLSIVLLFSVVTGVYAADAGVAIGVDADVGADVGVDAGAGAGGSIDINVGGEAEAGSDADIDVDATADDDATADVDATTNADATADEGTAVQGNVDVDSTVDTEGNTGGNDGTSTGVEGESKAEVDVDAGGDATMETDDIAAAISSSAEFSTLQAALEKAGLEDELKAEGPYTVFAPTNDAFAKLEAQLSLSADELLARDDLTNILRYHIAKGKILSSNLTDGMEITMINGDKAIISLGTPLINDSAIVQTDTEVSNGVIHSIDAVLLPLDDDAASTPIPKTGTAGIATWMWLAGGSLAAILLLLLTRRTPGAVK